MRIYQREEGRYTEESQFQKGALHFLYQSVAGRFILKYLTLPLCSRLAAAYYRHPLSKKKIAGFVRDYGIDMGEYEEKEYRSFDDFFIRRIKRGARRICPDRERLISPADAKLSVYPLDPARRLTIKGIEYSLEDLLLSKPLARKFRGGSALLFRLAAQDYHRYAFVEDGEILARRKIRGRLHSVSSYSRSYPVFAQNSREYMLIRSERLGVFVQMEIGALLIGGIANRFAYRAKRGREKGFFHFGASAILVLVRKGRLRIDADIERESESGTESAVKYGEGIGDIIC